jgi:purine-binding chemotaxis protein CheW
MTIQFTTFYIGEQQFGIDVTRVQEVTRSLNITPIPLAEKCITGLINLRGLITTAVDLGVLFETEMNRDDFMTVVCEYDGYLYSFIIERISDVVSYTEDELREVPDNLPSQFKNFLSGVFNTEKGILCIIDVEKLISGLEQLISKAPNTRTDNEAAA